MIISNKKRFIFIHIYKTGGMSVTCILKPYARVREKVSTYWKTRHIVSKISPMFHWVGPGNTWINGVPKHASAMEIRKYLGEVKFHDYFKFSFVRNPYDLQVSLYHYVKQHKENRDYLVANRLSFKEYMLMSIENEMPKQCDFLADEGGDLLVDYFGKTENIEQSLMYITNRLEIPMQTVKHKNRSKRRPDYMAYYDDELKEKVYLYFKKDFEIFDYDSGYEPR